jgi:hypothetical protein
MGSTPVERGANGRKRFEKQKEKAPQRAKEDETHGAETEEKPKAR